MSPTILSRLQQCRIRNFAFQSITHVYGFIVQHVLFMYVKKTVEIELFRPPFQVFIQNITFQFGKKLRNIL